MAKVGVGSWERQQAHPHQLGNWQSAVSSLIGVPGEAPAEIDLGTF